jgi:hypothetical protein
MRSTKIGIAIVALVALAAGFRGLAWAHCDTLDGPVVQDARKALEAKDVTPVLKWVGEKQEKAVRAAFGKALAARGKKGAEAAEKKFFGELVRIHRAGEGAPYTGLKPAGAVEPAVAEADKALAGGSPDALVKLVTDDVAKGIRGRYERATAAYKDKDKSVADGRKFVAAYVDYTHFVEGIHMMSTATGGHGEAHGGKADAHKAHKVGAKGKAQAEPHGESHADEHGH